MWNVSRLIFDAIIPFYWWLIVHKKTETYVEWSEASFIHKDTVSVENKNDILVASKKLLGRKLQSTGWKNFSTR